MNNYKIYNSVSVVDFTEHLGGELNLVMHGQKKKIGARVTSLLKKSTLNTSLTDS